MLFMLVACEQEAYPKYEYDDLDVPQVSSYLEGETMDGKYILYYYNESCSGCSQIKQDIIPFFMDFSLLDVYLLNTTEMFDISIFNEFIGVPSLFIIDGSKNLYETYIGVSDIRNFMDEYHKIELTIDIFNDQKVDTLIDYEAKDKTIYTLLYSDDEILSSDLVEELFKCSSSSLILINIDEAEEALNALFDEAILPALIVEGEVISLMQGEEEIINYLQE